MQLSFFYSFKSEWLKTRHSLASWLTISGAFFIPAIVLFQRLVYAADSAAVNASPQVWEHLYKDNWQYMAVLLLPMGVILVSSLITQLEVKNNAWKLVHSTPQKLHTIFSAKLAVILVMLLQFFLLFNIGIYLTGVVPALFNRQIPFPRTAFPVAAYLRGSGHFLIACLPIVALQYLLSLQFRNFLVPVGVGLALLTASIIAAKWKYGYIIPYIYGTLKFIGKQPAAALYTLPLSYFCGFTIASWLLYYYKKQKA
ncbi:hypothetical protein SAMN04488505_1109 [Chitinophaga rupis]|uniref:ABC-2 family transporter protein n=1 Tax=Chitinophaga rupis TaxID=573321 RepID=A0A1H8G206_9BACT|nr:ABC transporter permease [Chitinophaga rupis]SEN38043.1 hypothetical protein SAMN04488505_1109 [Chitinophaga rupis]